MLVTTTSNLEGHTITEYVGVVSAHVVAGTGLFSDWAASFSDVFGGRSHSYQQQLAAIHEEATAALVKEARRRRAHAIVGVRLDADEISGKGKSMLMVTATGTAVRLERPVGDEGPGTTVDVEDYLAGVDRVRFIEKGDKLAFSPDTWAYATEHGIAEVAPHALRAAARECDGMTYAEDFFKGATFKALVDYLAALPPGEAMGPLYDAAAARGSMRAIAVKLIDTLRLADYDRITALLSGDFPSQRLGTTLALSHKPGYEERDVEALKGIREAVARLAATPRARREQVKGVMSTREVLRCECGGEVDAQTGRCRACGADELGFKPEDQSPKTVLRALDYRIEALSKMLAGT